MDLAVSEKILIDKEEVKYKKIEDKKDKKIESGIEMQVFVIGKDKDTWNQIYKHYEKYGVGSAVSALQLDILRKMSLGQLPLPSEKQSKILYQLYEKATAEGAVNIGI